MAPYIIYALLGAIAISAYALVVKVVLRYRICSAGFVAFSSGTASGVAAVAAILVTGIPLPPAPAIMPLLINSLAAFGALYATAKAMQEGDPSTVVPIMGLKIPFIAVLSYFILSETHSWQIYLAALLSAAGVSLFGIGPQQRAQGGHGYKPIVGIMWAILSAGLYALSDQYAKLAMNHMQPLGLVFYSYAIIGILCFSVLLRPHFRMYRVAAIDVALLSTCGLLLLAAVYCLFSSFSMAGEVTRPNILFATRGFITLVAGYIMGKSLKIPIERQPNVVYLLRVAGVTLLFVALAIVI